MSEQQTANRLLRQARGALDAGDRSRFIEIIRDETERLIHLMAHVNGEAEPTV